MKWFWQKKEEPETPVVSNLKIDVSGTLESFRDEKAKALAIAAKEDEEYKQKRMAKFEPIKKMLLQFKASYNGKFDKKLAKFLIDEDNFTATVTIRADERYEFSIWCEYYNWEFQYFRKSSYRANGYWSRQEKVDSKDINEFTTKFLKHITNEED